MQRSRRRTRCSCVPSTSSDCLNLSVKLIELLSLTGDQIDHADGHCCQNDAAEDANADTYQCTGAQQYHDQNGTGSGYIVET